MKQKILYKTLLFERLPRGLKPTAAGQIAILSARVLLGEMETL
jgi:DNA-binding transcriptional LysR family regulator